ncbi:MAG TPA: hypothetical protein VL362_01790 [Patescibacteria group bacterium]|jgi:hypothetical protein|nr:hypothetical protein [Patescibacteria group bacterium]
MIPEMPTEPAKNPSLRSDYLPLLGRNAAGEVIKPHLQLIETQTDGKKVVRIEHVLSGHDIEREVAEINAFRSHLKFMRDHYGIAALEPRYVVGQHPMDPARLGSSPDTVLYTLVNYIEHATSFEEVLDREDAAERRAFGELFAKIVALVGDTCRFGGPLYPEIYRLDQYVINADMPEQGPICVDVVPYMGCELPPSIEYLEDYTNRETLQDTLRWLVEDALCLDDEARDLVRQLVADQSVSGRLSDVVIRRINQAIETQDMQLVSVHGESWWESAHTE